MTSSGNRNSQQSVYFIMAFDSRSDCGECISIVKKNHKYISVELSAGLFTAQINKDTEIYEEVHLEDVI